MIAGFYFALSRLRLILLPLMLSGAFAAVTALAAPAAPLYRVAGRTSGKALSARSAATTATGQTAPTGRVTTLDRASLSSVATLSKGMQVTLPLTDASAVGGTVNLVRVEGGWTRSGGSLDSATPGTFYLTTDGTRTEGFILRPDLQLAYRFETLPTGETVLREVPLNAVVCGFLPPFVDPAKRAAQTNDTPVALVAPILNSRPAATATLYLDFDGETVQDPAWDGGNVIVAPPRNLTTSDINVAFQRVKEDYWPFNINVTTDVARYNSAPVGRRMRCIITPNDAAAPGAGGVAYLTSFRNAGRGFTDNIPCWVFNPTADSIAEAISHELGHTFGLNHDGREIPDVGHEEYFAGQGDGPTSWAPIMGVGYYVNVVQWSKGEYQYANNKEDDVATISSTANGFGYVPDEAGDTAAAAAKLTGTTGGSVSQPGVITKQNEIDYYSFTTTGGAVSFSATGGAPSPNLDIALSLQRGNGDVVIASNPTDSLSASLTATLPRGTYFLKVTDSGAGDPFLTGYSTYGSIGLYNLTGTVPGLGVDLLPNLTPTSPEGADDKLVISNVPGTSTDAPTFYATDNLYLDFSVLNNGDSPAATDTITAVYIDDVLKGTVTTPADLLNGEKSETDDFDLGFLPTGQHVIRVQVDNGNTLAENSEIDNAYSRTILVTVVGPPQITSAPTTTAQVGVLLYFTLKATNAPSYEVTGLPPGLYLKPDTNIITGAPTLAGTFQATVHAANTLGSDEKPLTITVIPAPPVLGANGPLTGEVGTPFTYQIAASNSPAGYSAAGLPPGLTLDRATGIISGTPTAVGTYTVTVQAANAGGANSGTTVIEILVAAPKFTNAATAQGRVGIAFSFQATATDVTGGYGATNLPNGLTIDPITGLISGIPTEAGTFAVILSATNTTRTAESTLTLTITAAAPIAAWGATELINVPADLDMADVVALAAGTAHSLALKGDGTVEAWGLNNANQLNVPAGLTDVVSVSAGAFHNLALRRDGTVIAWGANEQGQTDVPTGLKNVVAVAAGTAHSLALRADGSVVAWGSNAYGQATPPAGLTGIVGIAAGAYHNLALHGDGTVSGWGNNGSGQLNVPATLTGVKQVAAGLDFSLILRASGSVIALGSNNAGQLVLPPDLLDVMEIAAGGQHGLAVHQDGTVATWGSNTKGESTPPTVLLDVAKVAAGFGHSLALVHPGVPRAIAAMPTTGTATLGRSASLVAYGLATGAENYQWAHNGVDIPNAYLPYLYLANLTEAQAGTYTFRLTNADGTVTSSAATLTLSAALPTVTLAATTPQTFVGSGTPAIFTVTRTGDTSVDVLVRYSITGSAENGTDYVFLKGVRKIKAGKSSAKIKVTPQGFLGGASRKIVKLTLQPGDGYTVETTEAQKVKILGAIR